MVKQILMWEAKCDSCDAQFELYNDFVALNDQSALIYNLVNDDDWSLLEDGRCYCSNCHTKVWVQPIDQQFAYSKKTEKKESELLGVVIQ